MQRLAQEELQRGEQITKSKWESFKITKFKYPRVGPWVGMGYNAHMWPDTAKAQWHYRYIDKKWYLPFEGNLAARINSFIVSHSDEYEQLQLCDTLKKGTCFKSKTQEKCPSMGAQL